MDVNNIIALNAKALREQRRLTLDAAAEATGVSRSMLAQIEKGDVNPTISVLWKIANGYKVSFTAGKCCRFAQWRAFGGGRRALFKLPGLCL